MKVRVLYFASYKELTGLSEEEVDLDEGSSVEQLVEALKNEHESLRGFTRISVAVNNEFVRPEAVIRENDRVALFPPVSGG